MNEEWKDIIGYDECYQVSNFGRVKSLRRDVKNSASGQRIVSEKILKHGATPEGYLFVNLSKENKQKNCKVSHLVWDHFGSKSRDGRRLQVDHIDSDIRNNHINNLQILSQRDNISKGYVTKETTSKYPGVHWHKIDKNWQTNIYKNGKCRYLGRYKNEFYAFLNYTYCANILNRNIYGGKLTAPKNETFFIDYQPL